MTPSPATPAPPNPSPARPEPTPRPGDVDVEKIRKALPFFRVMAFMVGVGLLLLVTEIVLKYSFSNPVLAWWQTPHGFLYMIYLVSCANLGLAARWPLTKTVLTMLAGCVPLLSFVVEHRRTREVMAQVAGTLAT